MNEEKTCCSFQATSGNASFLFPFATLLFLFQNTSDMVQRKRFLLMVCTLKGSAGLHCWPGYYIYFFFFIRPVGTYGDSGDLSPLIYERCIPKTFFNQGCRLCQPHRLVPLDLKMFHRAWILVFFSSFGISVVQHCMHGRTVGFLYQQMLPSSTVPAERFKIWLGHNLPSPGWN